MQRIAAMLAALAMSTVVAGCGGHEDRNHAGIDAGAGQLNMLTRGDALPQGHPPVAGYGHGLPSGHPVCPAGRQQLERAGEGGAGSADDGPRLISI